MEKRLADLKARSMEVLARMSPAEREKLIRFASSSQDPKTGKPSPTKAQKRALQSLGDKDKAFACWQLAVILRDFGVGEFEKHVAEIKAKSEGMMSEMKKGKFRADVLTATTPEGIEQEIRELVKAEGELREHIAAMSRQASSAIVSDRLNDLAGSEEVEVCPKEVWISFDLDYAIDSISVLRNHPHDKDNERVAIEMKEKGLRYIVPRGVDGHHGAMAESSGVKVEARLIVHVFPRPADDFLLDRGVCWVFPGTPGKVSFTLKNLNTFSNSHELGEIAGVIRKVEKRVKEVLNDIFKASQAFGTVESIKTKTPKEKEDNEKPVPKFQGGPDNWPVTI